MQNPESLVKAFIADYCIWNDRSDARHERDPSREDLAKAEAEYAELLSRYCRTGFRGVFAFGSPSDHDPNDEIIRQIVINNDRATVKTINTNPPGFVTDYKYLLVRENGRWFLEALDYVTDEGRIPLL